MSYEKVSIFFPNPSQTGMNGNGDRIYRFETFLLNVAEGQLFDGDREIQLTPKTFEVLVYLVENAGRLVRKDELMNAVWPDVFVEEVNVPRAIHHLRRTLSQQENGSLFIETVPTKGYRFTAPVAKGGVSTGREKQTPAEHADLNESSSAAEHGRPGERELRKSRPPRRILLFGVAVLVLVLGWALYSGKGEPLSSGTSTASQDPPTKNSRAYHLYLEGRLLLDRHYEKKGEEALAKFNEAIELDPNFSLAFAGKADAEWYIHTGPNRSHDTIARTRASIHKALALDPNNAYAHTLLCRVFATYDWDFTAAERSCRRAVELDPQNSGARGELAMFFNQFARHGEAMDEIDAAIALSPTSYNKQMRAVILFYAKRYPDAIEQLEQIRDSDPEFTINYVWLWWAYAMNGEHERSLDSYLKLENEETGLELRNIYTTQGWPAVQSAIAGKYKAGGRRGVHIAALHCRQTGSNEEVFEFLEGSLKNRELWMIHLFADPRFEPCRGDKRFGELLKRVGVS